MDNKKKSSDERSLANIILTTAILNLIRTVINLVDKLLN